MYNCLWSLERTVHVASQWHADNHGDREVATGVREALGAPTCSTYWVNSSLRMVSFVALAANWTLALAPLALLHQLQRKH